MSLQFFDAVVLLVHIVSYGDTNNSHLGVPA